MNATEPVHCYLNKQGKRHRIHLGTVYEGTDWYIHCPTLTALLWSGARSTDDLSNNYTNAPIQLAIAADYIEDYPNSVSVYHQWGKGLPETVEFLALCLRSVVE